ncbi:MAG: hypothetical protein HY282_11685 [Nitrospirae bacterium]|nr:hypothetical protein [Candidatus Manganitrophaceae bacterium]
MRSIHLLALGAMGVFLLSGAAFAQNIQTNTTSTTVGSTTFGFAITPAQLGTVMQADTAPTCGARGADGVMTCTLTNYVKGVGMPGSFTGNPFKIVWTSADFGCGLPCGTDGGADPQTAPDFDGPNTLTGTINSTIDLGIGTATGAPFHLAGHITFTLDPATMKASIDQQVIQEINAATGLTTAFEETDKAASFVAGAGSSIFSFSGPVNMTTSMHLTQTGEQGLPSPTPFTLDVTTPFAYNGPFNASTAGFSGSTFPTPETFFTPGLNTQPDDTHTPNIDESSLFPVIF